MPRVWGKPNIKPRQQLPCPEGVTTIPCRRCLVDTHWTDYVFRNSKERPGTLYRSHVCRKCQTAQGRIRVARYFVAKAVSGDDLELGLFLIDRAMCGDAEL